MYERFKELLDKQGGTINSVAKAIEGIDATTLYAWRDGAYTPKIDKLCKIADYFGVPVTEFIDVKSRH